MEQLWFTELLNRLFGGPVLSLLLTLGIHPKRPATPISNSFAMEVLVMLLLVTFFIAVRLRLSVDQPGGLQHTMEGIENFIGNMGHEIIGHHYKS
jgi:F-type H+-transporting ATPase subunit a